MTRRNRIIKPDFFVHAGIGSLPPLTRLLFIGLWTMADKAGRLWDRPQQVKAELLPYDTCDADAMLAELAAGGFIRRYAADGQRCIQVVNFSRHQALTTWEATKTVSMVPPMSGEDQACQCEDDHGRRTEVVQECNSRTNGTHTEHFRSDNEVQQIGREEKRMGGEARARATPPLGPESGRKRLLALLGDLLLDTSDQGVDEFRALLRTEVRPATVEEGLYFLRWATQRVRERGKDARYARHLIADAIAWRKDGLRDQHLEKFTPPQETTA